METRMKNGLIVLLISCLTGCGGATLHNAKQAAWDGALGAIIPQTTTTSGSVLGGGATSGQPGSVVGGGTKVIAKEDIFYQQEQRTAKNYGSVIVSKRERNPAGRTLVVLSECSHPKIGGHLACNLGMREVVSQEGWLSSSLETMHHEGDQVTLAAGKYYVIVHNSSGNYRYVASGEIDVQVGVTNYITAVLE